MRIPVSEPLLTGHEFDYVADCLRTGWISSAGGYIDAFEEGWAAYCGRRYGVAVSNGTVALQLAVRLLELKAGDEVIMPTFTIISCAQAILYAGAVPVLVDSDPVTWGMDPAQIVSRIGPRTRAIMVVHIYGHPVDMDPILKIAEQHNLIVLEDAAEAHGAEYLSAHNGTRAWRRCGSFGTVSIFSFYANKIISTGEGGMLLTDDEELAERARRLRNLAFQPKQRFLHEDLGFNFRMTNMQAAVGVAQLESIAHGLDHKRWMASRYSQLLTDLMGLQLPYEQPWAHSVYWMYGVVLKDQVSVSAQEVGARLADLGIETRPFFLGMHEQPVFRRMGLFCDEDFPVAEMLARRGLYLPSGLSLTEGQVESVSEALHMVLAL